MSIDHGDLIAAAPHGDTLRALSVLEVRRFRGTQWLDAEEVARVARAADTRIASLAGELDRARRENEILARQVELLRHGALPNAAPQGPDPMMVEMAMRAQDEANRTISEASAEGAEIIADARRHADDIIAEAHRRAGTLPAQAGPPAEDLHRQLRELESRHATLTAAAATAQQHLSQWQAHLSAQAEQLRVDAAAAGTAGAQLRQLIGG